MKRVYTCQLDYRLALVLGLVLPSLIFAAAPSKLQLDGRYGKLPLSFEQNQGQSDGQVRFLSRGPGYSLFLTDDQAVFVFGNRKTADTVRMRISGATQSPKVLGLDPLGGKANYFVGNNPAKWRSSIPTFGRIKYANVYPGTDLVYYGNAQQLEYDFIVAPGADPRRIRLKVDGAGLRLDDSGDLVISTKRGSVSFHKPVAYQWDDGQRKEVRGSFQLLANNSFGFTVGKYDPSKPLIIDPSLAYSTLLGYAYSFANGIAVDSGGNAYITGEAAAFPTTQGSFQSSPPGAYDAFVTKLNATGSALIYSTYLGGGAQDIGEGIAIDTEGNVFIGGETGSNNFPTTTGAFQTKQGSGFLTKLNATGAALIYSTYFTHAPDAIAIDASGDAFLTGISGNGLPVTAGAYETSISSIGGRAFVTKFNPFGTGLIYSTYVGLPSSPLPNIYATTEARTISVGANGNAYIAGVDTTEAYPTTPGAFQTTSQGGGFVTELNFDGSGLVYSTYLSGSSGDTGVYSINVDASGSAYVVGTSSNFPVTPGAFQASCIIPYCSGAYVAKLNSKGTGLEYATYLRGSAVVGGTSGYGIVVDDLGNAIVTGITSDPTFPVTSDAFQLKKNGLATPGVGYTPNGFLTKFNSTGTALIYSTFIGGSTNDVCCGVAIDPVGNAYIAGQTFSKDFPTTQGAFQTVFYDDSDTFVAKFGLATPTGPAGLVGNITAKSGTTDARLWSVQVTNGGPGIALGAQINGFTVTQTGGAACSPVVTSPIPMAAGDLAPGASITVPISLNFTSCAALARFTVTVSLSANSGSDIASIVRLNQFR